MAVPSAQNTINEINSGRPIITGARVRRLRTHATGRHNEIQEPRRGSPVRRPAAGTREEIRATSHSSRPPRHDVTAQTDNAVVNNNQLSAAKANPVKRAPLGKSPSRIRHRRGDVSALPTRESATGLVTVWAPADPPTYLGPAPAPRAQRRDDPSPCSRQASGLQHHQTPAPWCAKPSNRCRAPSQKARQSVQGATTLDSRRAGDSELSSKRGLTGNRAVGGGRPRRSTPRRCGWPRDPTRSSAFVPVHMGRGIRTPGVQADPAGWPRRRGRWNAPTSASQAAAGSSLHRSANAFWPASPHATPPALSADAVLAAPGEFMAMRGHEDPASASDRGR